MDNKEKERIHRLINFRGLAQELKEKGYPLNEKNFFPSRIGIKYKPILLNLEKKIQSFLNDLDKSDDL